MGSAEKVIIWAPSGRDGSLICRILEEQGFRGRIIDNSADLKAAIASEVGAGIIAEEALTKSVFEELIAALDVQPAWSDFPIVLLTTAASGRRTLRAPRDLGNVTLLERPIHVQTLIASVQAALRARERQYAARDAIRQREQFLAMLGHELRNPLGAILFAAEFLSRKPAPEAAERHLGVIDRQARHLTRLVDDLLEVSRVTTGKVVLNREPIELGESLQKTIQALQARVRMKKHALTFTSSREPAWVNADPVRLEQIFGNLLTNAIKYTPDGGTIEVGIEKTSDHGIVRIRDSGIGIDRSSIEQIFDLFAQANSTVDRSEGGMGLGLTLVRRLVSLHGGDVEAHSDGLGQGSEFVVRLPLSALPIAPNVPLPSQKPSPRPLRLVLVEDNVDICETLCDVLRDEGHVVQSANDGAVGVDLIKSMRPDCALVDIGLPTLSGYQVAERVRSHLGKGIHLVALTGYGQPEDRARALQSGFDRHLKKPIDLETLSRLLGEIAAQNIECAPSSGVEDMRSYAQGS